MHYIIKDRLAWCLFGRISVRAPDCIDILGAPFGGRHFGQMVERGGYLFWLEAKQRIGDAL